MKRHQPFAFCTTSLYLTVLLWGLSVAFSASSERVTGIGSSGSSMSSATSATVASMKRISGESVMTAATSGSASATTASAKRRRRMLAATAGIISDSGSGDPSSDDSDKDAPMGDESTNNNGNGSNINIDNGNSRQAGKLEALKQLEAELAAQLALVRREKLAAIRSRPLTIGIVGFGRFGQFIAKTFAKYGNVVVTSRSDYTDIAQTMGAKYIPLSDPEAFLNENLDVIVIAVSILSFDETIQSLAPFLQKHIDRQQAKLVLGNSSASAALLATAPPSLHGPLIVDVLSVKEHARNVMLEYLPVECDILCTHPMFGPDSGKDGWYNLNFVYEKTRIDKVLLLDPKGNENHRTADDMFVDESGNVHSVHENSEAHVEGMDRMERFLSIWEEEGCRMVPLSCRDHDAYAANSQFITHLVGRVLGSQGLSQTPIDTSGFQSVLKLVDSTTADSFDLFYGLYKYNQNSVETIKQLQAAMDDVVQNLQSKEAEEGDAGMLNVK